MVSQDAKRYFQLVDLKTSSSKGTTWFANTQNDVFRYYNLKYFFLFPILFKVVKILLLFYTNPANRSYLELNTLMLICKPMFYRDFKEPLYKKTPFSPRFSLASSPLMFRHTDIYQLKHNS